MAIIDNRTTNLSLALPNAANKLSDDVARIISAFTALDTAVAGKAASSSLSTVATSGAYSDLSGKPTIPTAVSALTNDSGYQTAAQVTAAISAGNSSTKVVTAPTLTGNTTAAIGASYSLSFSATSVLSGVTIASFNVTKPDGTVQTVTASSNAGSISWTAAGNNNDSKTFSVIATDTLGNVSNAATKTITLVQVSVNAVTITSPANAATGMMNSFTVSTGSFGVTNGTDTHASTDWEIWTGANRSGTLVWSSINDTTNKTSITVPSSANLAVNTTYYLAVRHKGTTYGYGGYGYVSFTTASQFLPTVFGQSFGGGFYAGKIVIGGNTYALLVAPKSSGQNASKQWKTTNDTTTGTTSLNDGLTNSNAMNNANHPAAQFCRGLVIGGYSDWYMPSRDELEICYRNLKPTTSSNTVYSSRSASLGAGNGSDSNGNGYNSNSLPAGAAYTSGSPAQTAAALFLSGGSEAFDAQYYWSSTEFVATYAWGQYFANGYQGYDTKDNSNYVRAVRKVLI